MFNLKKTVSLASAVSLASLSAAMAEDMSLVNDDLFAADGFLELDETPLTAAQLSEARGSGFPVGGLVFNITVVVKPPEIEPINNNSLFGDGGVFGGNGVFGDEDGPIGDDGLFGEDGVFGEGGVFGDSDNEPVAANNVGPVQTSDAGNAALPQAAPENLSTETRPLGSGGESVAPPPVEPASPPAAANNETAPAQNNSAPTGAPTAPEPSGQNAAPTGAQTTPVSGGQATGNGAADTGGAQTLVAPPQDGGGTPAPAGDLQADIGVQADTVDSGTGSNSSNGVADNSADNTNDMTPPLETETTAPDTKTVMSTPLSREENNTTGMSFSLEELSNPEVIQRIGPEGILTLLNNTLDNQRITSRVDIRVEVSNFAQAMNITKASNMTSRVLSQSVILGGFR